MQGEGQGARVKKKKREPHGKTKASHKETRRQFISPKSACGVTGPVEVP